MSAQPDLSLRRFWQPRYWPTWGLLLAMRATAKLPLRLQIRIGRCAGKLLFHVRRRDRRVARRNLETCFPHLAAHEREALLRRHFESVGLSLVEMAAGWNMPIERLRRIVEVRGVGYLEAAAARGGVLLVAAHFTPLEIGVAILEDLDVRFACMYRPQRNAMMDAMIRLGRSRFAREQIPRDNVRMLLKLLKERYAVLYLPDQTYLGNQSELVPFFGELAFTNVATSKIARIGNASVLTYFFRRRADDSGYIVEIGPPLQDFPTGDAVEDTHRLVSLLERQIRLAPEQYLWIYKKFKRRPAPLPNLYAVGSGD